MATVIDVAVASDGYMREAAESKLAKYGRGPGADAILRFVRGLRPSVKRLRQLPVVLTCRGLLHPPTRRGLRDIGVSINTICDLVWLVVRGSLSTYHQYHRSTFLI